MPTCTAVVFRPPGASIACSATSVATIVGVVVTTAVAAAVGIGLASNATRPFALGTPEYACGGAGQVIDNVDYVPITGAQLTLNNGTSSRNVELTFSVDAANGASQLTLAWGENGSAPSGIAVGPHNLFGGGSLGSTVVDVAANVASGVHTYQGYASGNGTIGSYCAVAQNKSN